MDVLTRSWNHIVAVVLMAASVLTQSARIFYRRTRSTMLTLAVFTTVNFTVSAQASASIRAADFDDCTIADGLMRPIRLVIKSAENIAEVAWPAFLLLGLLGAAVGLAWGGANKGIRIVLGGLGLLFVVWALLPAIGYNPRCTPTITVN